MRSHSPKARRKKLFTVAVSVSEGVVIQIEATTRRRAEAEAERIFENDSDDPRFATVSIAGESFDVIDVQEVLP